MLHIIETDLLDDDHSHSSPYHISSFYSYPIMPQEVTELTVDACSPDARLALSLLIKHPHTKQNLGSIFDSSYWNLLQVLRFYHTQVTLALILSNI